MTDFTLTSLAAEIQQQIGKMTKSVDGDPDAVPPEIGITKNMNTMVTASGDTCDIIGTIGSIFDDAVREASKLAEQAIHSAMKLMGELNSMVNSVIADIAKLREKIINEINELTSIIVNKITEIVAEIQSQITAIQSAISDIVGQVTDKIGELLNDLGKWIADISSIACTGVTNALKDIIGASSSIDLVNEANITGAISTFLPGVDNFASQAMSQVNSLKTIGTDAIGEVTSLTSSFTGSMNKLTALNKLI